MNVKFWSLIVLMGNLITFSLASIAQTNNPDDLPDNNTQMKTWSCVQGNQGILVEEKMVKNWQEIIDNWECQEQLVNIPDNSPQFSCESDENQINLITVTWLKGDNPKSQMTNWIKAFQEQNMTCIVDQTNSF